MICGLFIINLARAVGGGEENSRALFWEPRAGKIKLSYILVVTRNDARGGSAGKACRVQRLNIAARGRTRIILGQTDADVKVDRWEIIPLTTTTITTTTNTR